jgi:hypothetical protein
MEHIDSAIDATPVAKEDGPWDQWTKSLPSAVTTLSNELCMVASRKKNN